MQEMSQLTQTAHASVERMQSLCGILEHCAGLAGAGPRPASAPSPPPSTPTVSKALDMLILEALQNHQSGGIAGPGGSYASGSSNPAPHADIAASSSHAQRFLLARDASASLAPDRPDLQQLHARRGPESSRERPPGPLDRDSEVFGRPGDGLGELPSYGSAGHYAGDCKPCLYYYRQLCRKGHRCDFCHIAHDEDSVKRVRPSKKTRLLLQQRGPGEGPGKSDEQQDGRWQ